MRPILLMLFIYLSHFNLFGQDSLTVFKQNIRGKIVDADTRYPLIGAKIKVTNLPNQLIGGVCDENGDFVLKNVPVGKQLLEVTYLGYATREITVNVTSGRELIVNIDMEEVSITTEEVVVTSRKKEKL